MFKSKKKSDDSETAKIVADFLVEDYRFQQSFMSAVNKLFNEKNTNLRMCFTQIK